LAQKTNHSYLDHMLYEHARTLEHVVEIYTHNIDHRTPIHPEHAAHILDELADDDAIFTVDPGMCCVWAARYFTPNGRRRVIGSFLHGATASALPHAIGAQLAHPSRQVIALTSDGGLGMLLGELLTVRLYELPIKIIAFNKHSLGMVKLATQVAGLPDVETDRQSVDYAGIAKAIGLDAIRVEQPGDVRSALSEALSKEAPVLVDLVSDAHALSMCADISLTALKTVLEGGVGRMLDTARHNVQTISRPGAGASIVSHISRLHNG
jgi:pyruvate dehydrogenase (quinone)